MATSRMKECPSLYTDVLQGDDVSVFEPSSKVLPEATLLYVPLIRGKVLGPKRGKKGLRKMLRILAYLHQLFQNFEIRSLVANPLL